MADNTSTTPRIVPTRLPVVRFDYPDSESNKMRTRILLVAEATPDYIKGNELDSPGSIKLGVFKTFLRNRIATNGVALISY